jgi:hypothetical protein
VARYPLRDLVHVNEMLAHTSHWHNSDARIGDEGLIRRMQVGGHQVMLGEVDVQGRALAQDDAAHDAGNSGAVQRWCLQHAAAQHE